MTETTTVVKAAEETTTKLVDISRFKMPESYKRILFNEKIQENWKKQFKLPPQGVRVIKTSTSVCPVCNRQLPMVVYEENNAIWLQKTCPEHGTFTDMYWGDARCITTSCSGIILII